MLLNRLSLRTSLAASVLVMGFVGVVLAVLVAETYREYAIDSQRRAFEKIIGLRAGDLLDELARVSHDLGQSLQSEPRFQHMFQAQDAQRLTTYLQSQFHQYFVTAGVIRLESLAVYDTQLTLIAQVAADSVTQGIDCPDLRKRAAGRKGAARFKAITGLCLRNGRPHFSLLLPIGGLHVTGYLEVVTDPVFALLAVETELGMPLRIRYVDGSTAYESSRWPPVRELEEGVLASFQPPTERGTGAFTLSVARDVTEFENQLSQTRNIYVTLVAAAGLLLAVLMIFLLNKTALVPLQRLGDQLRSVRHDKLQLGKKVATTGSVEVRNLAAGFNEMTDELKHLYDNLLASNKELSEQIKVRENAEKELKAHRDHLEELVESRTLDLALARDAALEANRSKSLFLANMSHELRTPLNAIIGYSELIIEEAEERGGAALIPDQKKIFSAGRHLLALINDILDLTKIESGKMDLYEEWYDIREVVDGVVETIQPLVQQNNNTLAVKCADNIGNLYADITKTRQTLFNLLSNAVKFTQGGHIQLTVWREMTGEQEQVFFSVRDNGIGMNRDDQEKLFESFSQADASTTREFGGTGLGLVISQHFCHMMGGSIHVVSERGKGSTFTVMLPVQKKGVDIAEGYVGSGLNMYTEPGAFHSLARQKRLLVSDAGRKADVERREHVSTILTIDDDPAARHIMSHFLTQKGFNVRAAENGERGLQLAREIKPDVIMLDVMMPGMDGWMVLRTLKQEPGLSAIPVVMVTMMENRSMGYALGAMEYLSKPIDRKRLYNVVNRCVRSRSEGPVLIVENDSSLRGSVCEALECEGMDVVTASSIEAAFASMASKRPALIMFDPVVSGLDGFDFLEQLSNHPRWCTIPVIIVSSTGLSSAQRDRLEGLVAVIIEKKARSQDDFLRDIYETVNNNLTKTETAVRQESVT
ncbi:MAG: response regulator [Gammaproteobacteria bacterium]|nr:response regulator [Gammaproteobacteria bacterium]